MKKIYVTDWSLIPLFIGSAFSGVSLHVTDDTLEHEIWHNWAVVHVIFSLGLLYMLLRHIRQHKAWYKSLLKQGAWKKRKTILMLNFIFITLILTGLALLFVEGANSDIGLWHYVLGIIAIALSLEHIIVRIKVLRKSLNNL